jgi:hypothetical protein
VLQNGTTVACSSVRTVEGRSEPRVICDGDVHLYRVDGDQQLLARLLDVSNNGFRAMHSTPDLPPGREFQFRHRFFVGRARVVWTRAIAGHTESGFQVVRG